MKHLPFKLKSKIWAPVVITALVLISLWGVLIPDPREVYSFGQYQLGTYKTGLSLFLPHGNLYYTTSPLNDFVYFEDNSKTALLSQETATAQSYTSSQTEPAILNILHSVVNQSQLSYPSYRYAGDGFTAHYYVSAQPTTLRISQQVSAPRQIVLQGITLKYNESDIIFDTSGTIYSEVPSQDLAVIEDLTGIALLQNPVFSQSSAFSLPGKKVSLLNLDSGELLSIIASRNQYIQVDTQNNLIKVVSEVSPPSRNTLQHLQLEITPLFTSS